MYYSSAQERDTFIARLLQIWRNSLSEYIMYEIPFMFRKGLLSKPMLQILTMRINLRCQTDWTRFLDDYIPSDVKLVFVSEKKNVGKMPKEKGGQPLNEVTYRITGSTKLPLDIEAATKTFEQTVYEAHLAGVAFNSQGLVSSGFEQKTSGKPRTELLEFSISIFFCSRKW